MKLIQRPRKTSKPGSAKSAHGTNPVPYTSSTRLDFLVTKINGGAELRDRDLNGLDREDLVKLAAHIRWFRDESRLAQFPEQTNANLKLVEDALAQLTGGDSGAWNLTNTMLELSAPEFMAQLRGQMLMNQFEGLTHHEISSAGAVESHDPTAAREHEVRELPRPDAEADDSPAELERRARSLSGHESDLLRRYFPPWFKPEALSVTASYRRNSFVKIGESRLHLKPKHFEARNWRNPVINQPRAVRTLLHEAYHVFYHSLEGAPKKRDYPQAVENQLYQFSMSIGDSSMIDHFLNLNRESQAEMFSEGAAATELTERPSAEPLPKQDQATLASIAKRLAPVVEFVRRLPPDAVYLDILHPDQHVPPDMREPDPVAGPDPDSCKLFGNC